MSTSPVRARILTHEANASIARVEKTAQPWRHPVTEAGRRQASPLPETATARQSSDGAALRPLAQAAGRAAVRVSRERQSPKQVNVQAARATTTNTRGTTSRNGSASARESSKEHTAYMPRGNTAPQ